MNVHDQNHQQTVATTILATLQSWGVRHAFLVPGAQIEGFCEALVESDFITPVCASHELAAGYMADGYHRASGLVGVALSIGGPGAANMQGAATAARADSASLLFLTGNIAERWRGKSEFQDAWPEGTDDSALFSASLAQSELLASPADCLSLLRKLKRKLDSLCPVHLMVPLDVQYALPADESASSEIASKAMASQVLPAPDWWRNGRSVLMIGAKALQLIPPDRLEDFVARGHLPVLTDAGARGVLSENSQFALGHIGFMPSPSALAPLGNKLGMVADHFISIGMESSLQQRFMKPGMSVEQISPESFGSILASAWQRPDSATIAMRSRWCSDLQRHERPSKVRQEDGAPNKLSLPELIKGVASTLPNDTIYCLDAGQVRRQATKYLVAGTPRSILSAESLAPMGWGICAAIGAKLAAPERTVVAFTGDGSMLMHGMELATAARYQLHILFVICDNKSYASIAQRQPILSELARLPNVNWVELASSLGVPARLISDLETLDHSLKHFCETAGPLVLVADIPAIAEDSFDEPSGINWIGQ